MFKGPNIVKSDGSTGATSGNAENIEAIVAGGVTTAGYAAFGVSQKLTQASDADTLGFTAAYDSANKVLVRYHIDEFFTLNPNGVLWIMLVAQGTTLAAMCDKANAFAQKLINDSGKTIKNFGVVLNPASGYTPTLTNGIDADVTAAVTKAQDLITTFAGLNVFIDMAVIEGRQLNGASGSYKDMRTMASPNVHVAVLQDADVAALDALFAKHAAVGTVLAGLGVRRVSEDLGSVNSVNNPNQGAASMPINDAASGRWLNPGISSGALMKNLTAADVQSLLDKGYIFADSYPEFDGVYFCKSSAATSLVSDFAYGVATRVWNKCARIAVKKLIPRTNGKVALTNGKISATTASYWEQDVNNSRDGLGSVVASEDATATNVKINANNDIGSTGLLVVKMSVTLYGYARAIEGDLGFAI